MDSEEIVRAKARRVLDYVIGLESNSAIVSFPFYMDTITSSTVYADKRTPPPERIGILLEEGARSGLRLSLRPLLDEANLIEVNPKAWRGKIEPADRDAWFASYSSFIAPYLRLAELHRIATVILAAELNLLQTDRRWAKFVEQARKLYSGELSYSANWDAYSPAASSVPVDQVGVDAYPKLAVDHRSSVEEIMLAWQRWLDRDIDVPDAQLIVHEVGAAAEAQTFVNPAIPHTPGAALDQGVQRRWFTAACQTARERQFAGLYWWKIEFHVDPARADPLRDLHDSFIGREGEAAIRECFAAWGAAK